MALQLSRRAPRTNGKTEDDALLLSPHDRDSSPKRRRRRTLNPFRNPESIAVLNCPFHKVVMACASLCCLLSCLLGFLTMRGTTHVRRNGILSAPRTFTHSAGEWEEPPRSQRNKVENRLQQPGIAQRVLHRRKLLIERLSHGLEGKQLHFIGPIGREQDDSHEHEHEAHASSDESKEEISPQVENEEEEDDKCILPDAGKNDYDMDCNTMHEIDLMPTLDSFDFITCGGDRCVFRVTDINDSVVILKTLRYERPFNEIMSGMTRMDAFVMTKLTGSPYVMGIYGYCGLSQVVEYGQNGNIHDLIKVARETKEDKLSSLQKLKICVQIATAVADLHSIDVAHNDLCCHQFILVDGVYKLSDFDGSNFVKRNTETNETCLDYVYGVSWNYIKLRSPEEQLRDWNDVLVDRTKVDNYMMANIMYYVLTTHWLFEGDTQDVALNKIANHKRSLLPTKYLFSRDPAIRAIVVAIKDCWGQDPRGRPTSRKISNDLKRQLGRIEKVNDVDIVRVSVPPLPADFRYTDSDFAENMGSWWYTDDAGYHEDDYNDDLNIDH